MATLSRSPSTERGRGLHPEAPERTHADRGGPGGGGGGPGGDGGRPPAPHVLVVGMWIFLVPVMMLFLAFASAYIVRRGLGGDWLPIDPPGILWGNTGVLILSSVALEPGRRRAVRGGSSRRAVGMALLLGIAFAVGQILVWRHLLQQGLGMASSPHAAFFYLFTGAHVVHLLIGLVGLGAALVYPPEWLHTSRATVVHVASIYWHFLALLWLAIAGLLVFVR